MSEINIGTVASFDDPGRRVIEIAGMQVGVFRLDGEFYAYENKCQHLGGPACQGKILPRVLEAVTENKKSLGRVFARNQLNIICPWHGFEFNIRTGRHPGDRNAVLTPVEIKIRNHDVFVIV